MDFRKKASLILLEDGVTPTINLENYLEFSDTLVETGTCLGQGVERALDAGYTNIRSVEMVEQRFIFCQNKFIDNDKVKLWLGDSRDNLFDMISDKPCVILLDAHPSGRGSAGHDDLIKNGNNSIFHQERILTDEIKIILKSPHKHLLILDDTNVIDPIYTSLLSGYRFEIIGNKFLECIPQ
jgi:hypothetical protein